MQFVSMHTHTTYSYADGFGPVRMHVDRVADLGMRALGISEHGNVNSHPQLEQECRRRGIKPVFGIEAYLGPVGEQRTRRKYHITLFAQDEEGYRNLNRIVTQSYIDAHQFPTVSDKVLRKYAKGIVAFSGCSDSFISCSLLGGKLLGDKREVFTEKQYASTVRRAEWFNNIFEGRFYLEVQRFPGLNRTCTLNPTFARISADTGIPLIATADVHYPFPDQNDMQKTLHAARRGSTVAVIDAEWEYDILLTYPTSDEEIINDLVGTGLLQEQAVSAVLQTKLLADQCTVELPKAHPLRFPGVGTNGLHTDSQRRTITSKYTWEKLREGWKKRCSQRPDLVQQAAKYNARLKEEMKVINGKDFCDYFLATADLVNFAKSNDITVGPGRGSAAGSVTCYILGITEIDPLHPTFERMIFERFIDPTRSDMPDIDLDFDDEQRYKVIDRAVEIYGEANVCSVANHTGYRGKNTLKDIARAYGLPENTFKPIAKRISDRTETDERLDDSILDTVTSYANSPDVRAVLDVHGDKIQQAIRLEGNEHSMGIHAGGFIISSEPISDVCAIYTKDKGTGRKRQSAQVIPYDKRDAEYLGMLKMDFLGLTTMGMLGLCRKWTGMNLDQLYSLFYTASPAIHENILDRIRSDDVTGIFQYEGGTTRQVTRDVLPTNFDELAACNALSRPGPYYGGQTKEYIAVKNGEKDWERIHPNFDQHVEWTYGQIVYQEQIMFILRDVAGFDIATVLRVRKIIGKKLGEHQFAALWTQFRDGVARQCGIGEDDAQRIWGAITTAAGYAFNVAHAYSYALIAWLQTYFKIYKPPAVFFASSLAKNGDSKDNIARRTALLQDADEHGVIVDALDPSIMGKRWQPNGDKNIVPGFQQMPDIGEATADDIVAWRASKAGTEDIHWWDLINVKGVGEATIIKMAEFSVIDDPFRVNHTARQLNAFRDQTEQGEFDQFGLPASDEFVTSIGIPDENGYVAFVGLAANVVERDEIESQRQRTGKSVEEIKAKLAESGNPEATKKATIFAYDEYGEVALRISRWRYEELAPRIDAIKPDFHIIVAVGRCFTDRANAIQVTNLYILDPD